MTFGESLATVYNNAFVGCSESLQIYFSTTTPPYLEDGSFSAESATNYATTTIYVPAGTRDAYIAAGYDIFGSIVEYDTSGISAVESGSESAQITNKEVTLSSPADIAVYTQAGVMVKRANGVTSLSLESLPSGIYVVKAGNTAAKIVK